jgi:virginiamycin B lyase
MHLMLRIVIALLLGSAALQTPRPPKPGVKAPGVKIPIERLQPEAVFPYPGSPDWIAVDEDVWVSNKPKDSVIRLNPKTNAVVATIPVGSRPCSGLTTGFGSLWVPNCGDQTLSRVDLKTGGVTATIPMTIGNTEGSIRRPTLWSPRSTSRRDPTA